MVDTETYTIEAPDGESEALELPEGLVDVLSEQGDTKAEVVTDIALLGFVQRSHAFVHHSEEEVPADLEAINERAEELFEERFGVSYAEATGHQH